MSMAVGPNRGVKNEINVTPLVDVVLVLLIIFMVVTPMLQRGKDVRLPKAQKIEKKGAEKDPLILSVTADKKVYLERDPYDDDSLEKQLRAELQTDPSRRILLKGDQTLAFGEVRRVMDIARKAGSKGIAIGVEEIKAGK